MTTPDSELAREFARNRSEKAFATLVNRHVDLVYSAALRQVRSPQLAEEVAQTVFLDLARNAEKLASDTILTAWLYRVTRRAAIDVVRSESRRQLREQIAVELAAMNSPNTHWKEIEPLLDEAMDTLDEIDRTSVLLRFFENKSLREVGERLGTSDDAAQKRVSRAVERLREFFSKHGMTIGASGLAVVISGNAVQAAPIGFALTISSALAGTTLATATTATAIKTVAMTTLQKSLITAVIVAAVVAGIYEAREASNLSEQVESLKQQRQNAPADQLQQLTSERDTALRQLADLREENERLNRNSAELIRLRGEVGLLRRDREELARLKTNTKTHTVRSTKETTYNKKLREIQTKVLKEQFAALFKSLNLPEDEQNKLIESLVNKQSRDIEKVEALRNGEDIVRLQNEMNAEREAFYEEVKFLLGENNFQQFRAYEFTVADRGTVDHFNASLKGNPMTNDQAEQLLEISIQERAKFPILDRADAANILRKFDPKRYEQFFQAQEIMDQQVRLRAAAFLNAQQIEALTKFQSNNLVAQKRNAEQVEKLFSESSRN